MSSLKKYFKLHGDPLGNENTHDDIQIFMPVNIRWSFPKTRSEIKIENKFAALPIRMPLVNNMKDSYKTI